VRVCVFDDDAVVAQRAATLIAQEISAAVAARGRACLAFSGGRTPWAMMRLLAPQDLPWRDVHIFQTDERVVPPDDAARTLPQLRGALLSQVPLRPEQVHAMPVDDRDLDAAARRYATILEQIAGTPPVLDLVHLGLGDDGHTASLVPGDDALNVTDADVTISGSYQGHRRMTLTFPVLNRAAAIVWLVTGQGKAEAMERLVAGDSGIPAGRVRPDRAVIFADRAAARLLPKDAYQGGGEVA
jgi:6-phosphogluconolactonase